MSRYLVGDRVLLEDGYLGPATLLVNNGEIQTIWRCRQPAPDGAEVLDFGNLVVMPGLVDSHVHVNEPGRTDWEGYTSATRAAAAGGITTIVDMPLNSIPPTTTPANLCAKLAAAEGQCYVDVAFWGGVVPDNAACLRPMISQGVPGFKCFLINSGVDEFPHVTAEQVERALQELQGTGAVLLFHAEVDTGVAPPSGDPDKYATFLASRPKEMENQAIQLVASMCQKYGVRCHVVHLSSAEALPIIAECRASGAPLTVETCNHYLSIDAADVADRSTQFKCCPPIREAENKEALWTALKQGVIDMVVSDHSPCTPDLKRPGEMDFLSAWGGIASVQFNLPVFWTEASRRELTFSDVSTLMSLRTARLAGLAARKGVLREGADADLVVWDPDHQWTLTPEHIIYRNKLCPYVGRLLRGRVHKTLLRGEVIYDNGTVRETPRGCPLLLGPPPAVTDPAATGADAATSADAATGAAAEE